MPSSARVSARMRVSCPSGCSFVRGRSPNRTSSIRQIRRRCIPTLFPAILGLHLGQRRPELTDELYQTWREVEQRSLKETPEYREVLLRADAHALWLAGLVSLAARPVFSPETKHTDTVD